MFNLHEIRGQVHAPTSDVICTVIYLVVSEKEAEAISLKHCVYATVHELVVFSLGAHYFLTISMYLQRRKLLLCCGQKT